MHKFQQKKTDKMNKERKERMRSRMYNEISIITSQYHYPIKINLITPVNISSDNKSGSYRLLLVIFIDIIGFISLKKY